MPVIIKRCIFLVSIASMTFLLMACDSDKDSNNSSDTCTGDECDFNDNDGSHPDDTAVDGDQDRVHYTDGDTPDPVDGDVPMDGDVPEDGDTPTDGDIIDGDQDYTQGESEVPADGDVPEDGDEPEDPNPTDIEHIIREADIYKLDGDRLLVLNPHLGLVRIDVSNPREASVTGRLPMLQEPDKLYTQNRLALLLAQWGDSAGLEEGRELGEALLVSVESGVALETLDSMTFEGRIVDTRWIDDIIYLVLSEKQWIDPLTAETMGEDRIRLLSFDLQGQRLRLLEELSIGGEGLAVYVNENAVLISTPGADGSMLHYVDISAHDGSLVQKATLSASGVVRDRYKMNIREDILTVVSHGEFAGGTTFVETWDISEPDEPLALGFISLAPKEELHATIFQGNMLYVVTYLRLPIGIDIDPADIWPWPEETEEEWEDECRDGCDPLWTIDLSDPSSPQVLGELIIPGWSEHMVFANQKLFAVGFSDGFETKVSIFDVSNPLLPREDAFINIPGRVDVDPDELYDFKSFTILWSHNLMLVPVHAQDGERTALVWFDAGPLGARLILKSSMNAIEAVRRTFMISEYLGILAESQLDILDIEDQENPELLRRIMFTR